MNRTVFLIFLLVTIFVFNNQNVCAFSQQAGFYLGSCSYNDEIGELYDEQALLFGLHYTIILHRFFGVNFQYSYFNESEGAIDVNRAGSGTINQVKTDINGGLISISPTFYVMLHQEQLFVPKLGIGLSFYHGRQKFDDNPYLSLSDNEFNGVGINISAGFNFHFSPCIDMQLEGRYHTIRISIEHGTDDKDIEYNGIAEYYVGLTYTFGVLP